MNTMSSPQGFTITEKCLEGCFQMVRYFLTAVLVVFLVFAWLLTAPIFHCGIVLGDLCRRWDQRLKWLWHPDHKLE
ncbi:MAG TPA: hypothetical protein VF988_15840 [Verrucomicrobiae bacterium]